MFSLCLRLSWRCLGQNGTLWHELLTEMAQIKTSRLSFEASEIGIEKHKTKQIPAKITVELLPQREREGEKLMSRRETKSLGGFRFDLRYAVLLPSFFCRKTEPSATH